MHLKKRSQLVLKSHLFKTYGKPCFCSFAGFIQKVLCLAMFLVISAIFSTGFPPAANYFQVSAPVWRCLLDSAPAYLRAFCCSILDVRSSGCLRFSL